MTTASIGGFYYDGVAAGRGVRAGLSRRAASTRPLPMEELCFFAKSIDNSRLVRVVDPGSKRECLGLTLAVGAACLMALLLAAPYLAMLRSGYRMEDAKKEHQALAETNRQLQVKEAELRDPQRIFRIAVGQLGMRAPRAEQVSWAESDRTPRDPGRLLARNARGSLRASER